MTTVLCIDQNVKRVKKKSYHFEYTVSCIQLSRNIISNLIKDINMLKESISHNFISSDMNLCDNVMSNTV